jgi:ubiquinone/menaquinone biosynthesis C-methylase UbiE
MRLYGDYVVPVLTALAMRNRVARRERTRIVPRAEGVVLEIGVGSGLNIPLYGPGVRQLYGVDPSPVLLRLARRRAARAPFPVELLQCPAEDTPLASGSVDCVVTTWTLCTIPDPAPALEQVRRVLRPEGRLIFVEHGRSPDPGVAAWQDRLTPAWRKLAGGCHLNRRIDRLLASGGFEVAELEAGYAPGPRVATYLYRGVARIPGGRAGAEDGADARGGTSDGR